MVVIIAGAGLGMSEAAAKQLNNSGVASSGDKEQANSLCYVNAATGNLVLQFDGEKLAGAGEYTKHFPTYNSQGNIDDNNCWRWPAEKRLRLEGEFQQVGSRIILTAGDGRESMYLWKHIAGEYSYSAGRGANNTIEHNGTAWVWTDGASETIEKYDPNTGWIKSSRDIHGNGCDFTFNDQNQLSCIKDRQFGRILILNYDISTAKLLNVVTQAEASTEVIKQTKYSYDTDGRLVQVVADTNSITYTYDESVNDQGKAKSNRIASISHSDGTTISFTYEKVNDIYKIKTVADQAGVTTFNYGVSSTQVTNGEEGGTYTYHYDSSQRLTDMADSTVNGKSQSITTMITSNV